MDLFVETFAATITGPSGTEGLLYTDILIEAITDDDNDGNLNNGTPHLSQLLSAFAKHGITLLTNVNFTHSDVLTGTDQVATPVTVNFSYTSQFPWFTASTSGFYKINNVGPWIPFTLNNVSGSTYTGSIPAALAGDIISYFVAVVDGAGGILQTLPAGANDAEPNIPFYVMIDFTPLITEDFEAGILWTAGLPTDDAVTGNWIFDAPVGSFESGVMCQTDQQHTPGGIICAVTGNAAASASIGTNDLDSGRTTLISPVFDLSTSINPGFSYYRWYTNDQGATPKTEYWQVFISGDGNNWVPVELIKTPDHSWRRFALRVKDYIVPTATVSLMFVAEDSAANKGSLVEAAVDDLILYDATTTGIDENGSPVTGLTVYPSPAKDNISIAWNQTENENLSLVVTDNLGKTMYTTAEKTWAAGEHLVTIPVSTFKNGIYFLQMKGNKFNEIKKITVMK
jgi:hypothetical protein